MKHKTKILVLDKKLKDIARVSLESSDKYEVTYSKNSNPKDYDLTLVPIDKKESLQNEHAPVLYIANGVYTPKDGNNGDLNQFHITEKNQNILPEIIDYTIREYENKKINLELQRRLLEREQLFRAVDEFTEEAIIMTNSEGNIIHWSGGAEKIFGYKKREIYDQPVYKLLSEKSKEKLLKIISANGSTKYNLLELTAVNNVGAEIIVEFSLSSWEKDNKSFYIAVIRNLSKKKKMDEEILKAQKLESISVIAGGIAHDFNNILTGIITNLFVAKLSIDNKSEEYNLIMEAEKAAYRASNLTKQFLTFAKNSEPLKEDTSLQEVITNAVGFTLSGSNIDYTIDIDENLKNVLVDRGQIDQVISNIVLNAKQAMPNGGLISINAKNVVVQEMVMDNKTDSYLPLSPGDYVKISIKDTGIGIPRENISKIFDPYFSTKKGNSGFGLSTSYSIISKHGGTITVNSKEGRGSVFSFYLPALNENKNETNEITQSGNSSKKILIMDDEPSIQKAITVVMKHFSYECDATYNSETTLKKYKEALDSQNPYKAVILDLTIPGGKGAKETITELQKLDPDIYAIVTSGYSTDFVVTKFSDFGFKDTLKKPFTMDDITLLIKRIESSSN